MASMLILTSYIGPVAVCRLNSFCVCVCVCVLPQVLNQLSHCTFLMWHEQGPDPIISLSLSRVSVQCDLFADDGTLNTVNDKIDNIRRDLQQSLYDVSGWCCRNRMVLNPMKTKCMLMATRQKHQKKAPFKSKVRDHANRASFKTSPTWSNCRRTAKVANTY